MRGPSDKTELDDLRELVAQLRKQLADLFDESHVLHEQIERQMTYIAELEAKLSEKTL